MSQLSWYWYLTHTDINAHFLNILTRNHEYKDNTCTQSHTHHRHSCTCTPYITSAHALIPTLRACHPHAVLKGWMISLYSVSPHSGCIWEVTAARRGGRAAWPPTGPASAPGTRTTTTVTTANVPWCSLEVTYIRSLERQTLFLVKYLIHMWFHRVEPQNW